MSGGPRRARGRVWGARRKVGPPQLPAADPPSLPPLPDSPPPPSPPPSFADALATAHAFITSLLPTPAAAAASDDDDDDDGHWLAARCFPRRLPAAPAAAAPHDVLAVGSRALPIARARIHIYDFAVFADTAALPASAAAPTLRAHAPSSPEFGRALRSADDVPMSLVVRIARNIPVPLMRAEYHRILSRRIRQVGGDPDDAALATVVSHFRSDALPPSARVGIGSVRKGTLIEFRRGPGGSLAASADGVPVVTVTSPHLAAAVFDIYVGDEPACPAARETACTGAAAVVGGAARPPRIDGAGLVCERGAACAAARLD